MLIDVNTPSLVYPIEFGVEGMPKLTLTESDTIEWNFTSPDQITADLKISTAFAHRHYYDLVPVNPSSDYQNYEVNNISSPYMEGSLRVFINGTRIPELNPPSATEEVYVPNSSHSAYTLNSFTSDFANGTFALTTAITSSDVIRVDFDILLS
jgi:hypothetical protein